MGKALHTTLRPEQHQLRESIFRLFESYQSLDSDLIGESLSTGRMSNFLFEADDKAVIASTEKAIDAVRQNLDTLEKAGQDLNNSQAIESVVNDLRTKLASIELDAGAFASIKDFAGFTIKQITFIANGIAQAGKDIDAAVKTTVSALKTLKIDVSGDKSSLPISDLIEGESERTKVDSGKFMAAIKQKLSSSSKGGNWLSNAFKGLMGMLKGTAPISIDADEFADDLTGCTIDQLNAYLNSEAPAVGTDEGTTADESIQDVVSSSDIKPADIASAKPPGESAGESAETFARSAWLNVVKGIDGDKTRQKNFVDQVNSMAGKKILESANSRSTGCLESRWARLAGLEEKGRR